MVVAAIADIRLLPFDMEESVGGFAATGLFGHDFFDSCSYRIGTHGNLGQAVLRRVAHAKSAYRSRRIEGDFAANLEIDISLIRIPNVGHAVEYGIVGFHVEGLVYLMPFIEDALIEFV